MTVASIEIVSVTDVKRQHAIYRRDTGVFSSVLSTCCLPIRVWARASHTLVSADACHLLPDFKRTSPQKTIASGPDFLTTDPKQIHDWWNQWPDANVGLPVTAEYIAV